MKSTERFSNRADDYRRYRPGYPPAVVNLMRETCGLKTGAQIADIGSGTGILTKLLLEGGFNVTAVEPNEAMRTAAEEDLRDWKGFGSIAAPAEETGLPGASFDAITVAQAFHWFDIQGVRREFARLLRGDKWVFIIWNHRDAGGSPFHRNYETLLESLGLPYEAVAHRNIEARTRSLDEFFPPGVMRTAQFDNPQAMDWPALRGRFLSSSYAPAEGDPKHKEYISRLEELFQKYAIGGQVVFEQQTMVYFGSLV